jgi:VWFA-related protein
MLHSACVIGPVAIAIIALQSVAASPATLWVDSNSAELSHAVPELAGLKLDPSSDPGPDRLDALLRATGQNLAGMLAKFPEISAAEDIHEMRFESGMAAASRRETFRYRAGLLPNAAPGQLDEFRLDPNTNSPPPLSAKSDFVVFGHFIDLLNYMLPQNRAQLRFRYVGRAGNDVVVVAFAQLPGAAQLRSHVESATPGRSAPVQGLAWIDASTQHILRLRLDLLEPIEGLPLKSFSTDIALVNFESMGSAFWLPSKVTVHARYVGLELHTVHRFSGYSLQTGNTPGRNTPNATGDDAWELLDKGIVLTKENKPADAIAVLRQALSLNPEMPTAHFHLANAMRETGDFSGAEAEVRETLKSTPDSGPAHNFLAILLFKRGELPGAVAEFRASAELQPKDAIAHFNLAEALQKQGDTKAALDEYRTAHELAPDNPRFKATVERLASIANNPAAETTFKVNVRQVLVPVIVTDKEGHHVTGLTQPDFTVFEDGVEQKLSGFSVENVGVAPPSPTPAAISEPEPAAAATAKPARTPARRTYLICVDSLHAEFANLVHVRQALTKLFTAEQAGDSQYIVVALGRSIKVVQNTSSNPSDVLQALDPKRFQSIYLGSAKASQQIGMAAFRRTLDEIRAACDAHDPACMRKATLPSEANALEAQERQDNIAFLTQFRSLVEQLSHGAGRRTIILISDGFGAVPGKEAYELLIAYFPEFRSLSLRTVDRISELQPVLRLAANSNIPIYTIDSRGLYTSGYFSAANPGGGNGSRMPAILSAMNTSESDAGEVLTEIAAATGGTAFHNSNDLLNGLQRAFADGRSYYMLAYIPSNSKADGKFRAIAVRLRDSKMMVSAKKGYWPEETGK